MSDFIKKIEDSGLVGRSGSCYPTGRKWRQVKEAKVKNRYVVCNASEGEPEIFKDHHLLKHNLNEVISGIKLAIDELEADRAYIYLNKNYYKEFKDKLEQLCDGLPIILIEKKEGYIAGEETSLLEAIEGNPAEPRVKPPFPTEKGLWGKPTLVNNVETFYWVSKIAKGEYDKKRLVCVSGKVANRGVFEMPESMTIEEILKKTDNYPDFDFFAQVGGGVCGVIMLPDELNRPIEGAGSIVIYDRKETNPYDLMKKWLDFLLMGNCDKCTPCREGLFRISEMVERGLINEEILNEILFTMRNTSFCVLGISVEAPIRTLIEKVGLKKR